jgi:hypothetical protein
MRYTSRPLLALQRGSVATRDVVTGGSRNEAHSSAVSADERVGFQGSVYAAASSRIINEWVSMTTRSFSTGRTTARGWPRDRCATLLQDSSTARRRTRGVRPSALMRTSNRAGTARSGTAASAERRQIGLTEDRTGAARSRRARLDSAASRFRGGDRRDRRDRCRERSPPLRAGRRDPSAGARCSQGPNRTEGTRPLEREIRTAERPGAQPSARQALPAPSRGVDRRSRTWIRMVTDHILRSGRTKQDGGRRDLRHSRGFTHARRARRASLAPPRSRRRSPHAQSPDTGAWSRSRPSA